MRDLDKYIEYVIAQVGEGGHTRNELVDDLKERGLNDDEIEHVLNLAWSEGSRREDEAKQIVGMSLLSTRILLPLVLFILLLLAGSFGKYTFVWLIGGVIALVSLLFARKRFK